MQRNIILQILNGICVLCLMILDNYSLILLDRFVKRLDLIGMQHCRHANP